MEYRIDLQDLGEIKLIDTVCSVFLKMSIESLEIFELDREASCLLMPSKSLQQVPRALDHFNGIKIARTPQRPHSYPLMLPDRKHHRRLIILISQSPCDNSYDSLMKGRVRGHDNVFIRIDDFFCDLESVLLEFSPLGIDIFDGIQVLLLLLTRMQESIQTVVWALDSPSCIDPRTDLKPNMIGIQVSFYIEMVEQSCQTRRDDLAAPIDDLQTFFDNDPIFLDERDTVRYRRDRYHWQKILKDILLLRVLSSRLLHHRIDDLKRDTCTAYPLKIH